MSRRRPTATGTPLYCPECGWVHGADCPPRERWRPWEQRAREAEQTVEAMSSELRQLRAERGRESPRDPYNEALLRVAVAAKEWRDGPDYDDARARALIAALAALDNSSDGEKGGNAQ